MHALKMAVFDFDGTLVDSVPAIARGIQLANEEIGIAPVSYEMAKSIIGLGFKDIIPIVAPDLPESDPLMLNTLLERNGLTMDEIVMIGDTEHDIKLGKAAGVRTIAVTWGAAPLERLEAYKPDAIVRTMEALKTKLDELA